MIVRPTALVLMLAAPLAAEVRDLKGFFLDRCAVCHGVDGSGRGPNGVRLGGRNLADAQWLAKQPVEELTAAILKGRGAMPGFRRQISEAEARRILTDVIRPLAGRRRF